MMGGLRYTNPCIQIALSGVNSLLGMHCCVKPLDGGSRRRYP